MPGQYDDSTLRMWRAKERLTLAQAAKLFDVSRQTLSRWEDGPVPDDFDDKLMVAAHRLETAASVGGSLQFIVDRLPETLQAHRQHVKPVLGYGSAPQGIQNFGDWQLAQDPPHRRSALSANLQLFRVVAIKLNPKVGYLVKKVFKLLILLADDLVVFLQFSHPFTFHLNVRKRLLHNILQRNRGLPGVAFLAGGYKVLRDV